MLPATARSQAELHDQRTKLTTSYNLLLEEFSCKDLRAVGNYTLGHLIGKGSFGKVYLGHHKLTNGTKVVLKSTKKEDSNLAREIHHHRQFTHPHIARLYEVIVTESLVWLVLEYCPGDELYHYLTEHGPIEPERVQKMFAQLVGAVSYVHSKSCVHRDLKLENILLDKHGNVKLCDFGFTREYEGKSSYLQTWCGTVCYSAPEMLKGEKYAGEKVDVWSLGVILYALLCGELPFDEDDETATKMKILKEEPKYPDTIPAPAKDLIQSLLSKRPLLRPSLADVLNNSWLAEHAPQQQVILKTEISPPFATQVEKDTLQRLRSAGVNIDVVVENVLSQRCDSLAGWWAILLEKEQRKEARRLKKRQERESEGRSSRRISAASGRLSRLPSVLRGIDEEGWTVAGAAQTQSEREKDAKALSDSVDFAALPSSKSIPSLEATSNQSAAVSAARIANGNANAAKRRSQTNGAIITKRNSTLTLLAANPDFHNINAYPPNQKRRRPFLTQLAVIKSWFKDPAKRIKEQANTTTTMPVLPSSANGQALQQTHPIGGASDLYADPPASHVRVVTSMTTVHKELPVDSSSKLPEVLNPTAPFTRPPLSTRTSTASSINTYHRGRHRNTSHSPAARAQREPQSSGHKSNSSSVSSVRSLSHHRSLQQFQLHPSLKHTHSKASSTSSTNSTPAASNFLSPNSATASPSPLHAGHGSTHVRPRLPSTGNLRVLPPPPASPVFPSSIRVVRTTTPANLTLTTDMAASSTSSFANYLTVTHGPNALGPVSPGLPIFARGRRKVFKGPSFSAGSTANAGMSASTIAERRRARRSSADGPSLGAGGGIGSRAGNNVESVGAGGGSNNSAGGASGGGGLMNVAEDEEEEEGEGMESEIEELDAFSPVVAEEGVEVEIVNDGPWRGGVNSTGAAFGVS